MSSQLIQKIVQSVGSVLLGKDRQIKLCVACLIAKGHLLLEDLPGMGKTTLSHALAEALGMSYQRIQFTSDMLPSDILGVSVFNVNTTEFEFRQGPIFSQLVLADEINRATPKAQSALLEAMEERQVTLDGNSYTLPSPFFVIATQNPSDQMGTFSLPESQMDRFLMRIHLGYPDPLIERELITGVDRRRVIKEMKPAINAEQLYELQEQAVKVHLSDAVIDYIQRLVAFSRQPSLNQVGLSPRGTLALVAASKAYALVEGRAHVVPEDVQAVLAPVAEHRMQGSQDITGHAGRSVVQQMLSDVDVIDRLLL
ncbi:AAA family ATPase [Gammaproteobacteria bacterium 42_54_T18]|nr:AAA family ATPase [Gammaproteobacteria bacterium 42_54_T18]